MTALACCEMDTPVGRLTLVVDEAGLREVHWPAHGDDGHPLPPPCPVTTPDHPLLQAAVTQLEEYFAGRRKTFDLPLHPRGTEFQLRAWLALRDIPYGEVRTYGEQAAAIGRPEAARAVGAANGRNPLPIVVPCHRVIGSGGSLTGFAGGLGAKRWLLEHERAHRDPAAGMTLPLWRDR